MVGECLTRRDVALQAETQPRRNLKGKSKSNQLRRDGIPYSLGNVWLGFYFVHSPLCWGSYSWANNWKITRPLLLKSLQSGGAEDRPSVIPEQRQDWPVLEERHEQRMRRAARRIGVLGGIRRGFMGGGGSIWASLRSSAEWEGIVIASNCLLLPSSSFQSVFITIVMCRSEYVTSLLKILHGSHFIQSKNGSCSFKVEGRSFYRVNKALYDLSPVTSASFLLFCFSLTSQ